MIAKTPKMPSVAISLIVAAAGAVIGGIFLPALAPNMACDMGNASLRVGLHLTGHLDLAAMMPQIHLMAAVVSGLLTLALWELYCCTLPRQKEGVSQIVLLVVKNPTFLASLLGLLIPLWFISVPFTLVPTPADDVLLANFHTHRQSFEQFKQELTDSPSLSPLMLPTEVGEDGLTHGTALNDQLQLAKLGLTRIYGPTPLEKSYRFEMLVNSGSTSKYEEKGYFYCESSPTPVATSLDGIQSLNFCTYRHIEGNWYLYYRYHDM